MHDKLHRQVGRGEAAARGLAGRVTEGLAQLGGVGDGEGGAVQGEEAVSLSQGVGAVLGGGATGADDGLVRAVEEADGKALAGLAVGAVAEVKAGHMPQLAHGEVAVQDWQRKR
jgi:hypothetical protein